MLFAVDGCHWWSYVSYGFSGVGSILLARVLWTAMYLGVPMAIACAMAYWLYHDWEERRISGQWNEVWLTSLDSRTLLASMLAGVLRPFFWYSVLTPTLNLILFRVIRSPHDLFPSGWEILRYSLIGLLIGASVWIQKPRWRPFLVVFAVLALGPLWQWANGAFSPRWLLIDWAYTLVTHVVVGIPAGVMAMLMCSRVILDRGGLGATAAMAACADLSLKQGARLATDVAFIFSLLSVNFLTRSHNGHRPVFVIVNALILIAAIVAARKGWIPRVTSWLTVESPHPLRAMIIAALVLFGLVSFFLEYILESWVSGRYSITYPAWANAVTRLAEVAVAIFYARTCVKVFEYLAQRIHGQA
ncbi:MAG: hypothetical protein NTX50_03510 [Candidatus Sumerlaeota bacterium]|nr:hypothetical protein [Candidatus Sumerlaeota bacterium]